MDGVLSKFVNIYEVRNKYKIRHDKLMWNFNIRLSILILSIPNHFVDWFYFFSFAQAAAAAQAGASVIQIFVGRIRVISIFICAMCYITLTSY